MYMQSLLLGSLLQPFPFMCCLLTHQMGASHCAGQPLFQSSVQLPHVGPVVIGSDSAQDCDVITDAPGISGDMSPEHQVLAPSLK